MKNNKLVDGERGVMIAISSIASTQANNMGLIPYAATKGALESMMLPMAREMGPLGIRACAVKPCAIDTSIVPIMPDWIEKRLWE